MHDSPHWCDEFRQYHEVLQTISITTYPFHLSTTYLVMILWIEIRLIEHIILRRRPPLPSLLLLPTQVVRRIHIAGLEMSLDLLRQVLGHLISLQHLCRRR